MKILDSVGLGILRNWIKEKLPKLYSVTGQNIDGAMTQKAITDTFTTKQDFEDKIDIIEDTIESTIEEEVQERQQEDRLLIPRSYADTLLTDLEIKVTDNDVAIATPCVLPLDGSTELKISSLPIASETNVGLIPTEAYLQIFRNTNDIESMRNLGGRRIGTFETYLDLTRYMWTVNDHAGDWANVRRDENNSGFSTRYYVIETEEGYLDWEHDVDYSTGEISLATQETPGIVKGVDYNGKVYVEVDGTMTLVGFSSLSNKLEELNTLVESLKNKLDKTLTITNGMTLVLSVTRDQPNSDYQRLIVKTRTFTVNGETEEITFVDEDTRYAIPRDATNGGFVVKSLEAKEINVTT